MINNNKDRDPYRDAQLEDEFAGIIRHPIVPRSSAKEDPLQKRGHSGYETDDNKDRSSRTTSTHARNGNARRRSGNLH